MASFNNNNSSSASNGWSTIVPRSNRQSNNSFTRVPVPVPVHVPSQTDSSEYICVNETWDEYQYKLDNLDPSLTTWVYDILDGKKEQKAILYRDEHILIVPNWGRNGTRQDNRLLHILVFPTDRTLRTMRDLTGEHIQLLNHIKSTTLRVLYDKFLIRESQLNIEVHYTPSAYHLHIHFVNKYKKEKGDKRHIRHSLQNIMYNLRRNSDFYKSDVQINIHRDSVRESVIMLDQMVSSNVEMVLSNEAVRLDVLDVVEEVRLDVEMA